MLTITFLVSNYIQEASVTEAVENITVLCSVVQSEPLLICRAVFYCANNEATILNLSSGVAQKFSTTQLCNVTIQVVSSNDVSQVLEQTLFYNVLPSVQPTSPSVQPSSPSSTSNSEYLLYYYCCCDCYIRVFSNIFGLNFYTCNNSLHAKLTIIIIARKHN